MGNLDKPDVLRTKNPFYPPTRDSDRVRSLSFSVTDHVTSHYLTLTPPVGAQTEIDTEFEKLTASLLKNFNSMAFLMLFLRASLRQTMIRKLAMEGKDEDGWKKADEHLTTLMDQESSCALDRLVPYLGWTGADLLSLSQTSAPPFDISAVHPKPLSTNWLLVKVQLEGRDAWGVCVKMIYPLLISCRAPGLLVTHRCSWDPRRHVPPILAFSCTLFCCSSSSLTDGRNVISGRSRGVVLEGRSYENGVSRIREHPEGLMAQPRCQAMWIPLHSTECVVEFYQVRTSRKESRFWQRRTEAFNAFLTMPRTQLDAATLGRHTQSRAF
jgi:hypothetical protein